MILKRQNCQKLWRSPEQRYRYLEDFFVLLMEMIGWCGIYMAVLLYTKRTATEDILGMLTVPFLYGFTYALQRIELLVQRNVDTRTNGAKYQEYTGAIVLIIGHLLEIIFLYGLLADRADGKRYHCPLYVDRFMEYGCFDQMVADTQRAFQLYREMVFGGRSCIYIFVGNILRESTFSTFGSDFGSRPVDTPYVVWLFGAAQ